MSTDKIPNIAATIDEWAIALKWHPDLARDLRECRAAITGAPDVIRPLVVFKTTSWLSQRYKPLWNSAPTLPTLTIQEAWDTAVQAGAWSPATVVIQQATANENKIGTYAGHEGGTHRRGLVYADTFDDVGNVQAPEWVAHERNSPAVQALLHLGARLEDIPARPAILLTISPGGTREQAIEALGAAWDDIKPTLNPQLGTHPGKEARGRPPNFAQHVMHYRLWRQWPSRARRHGDKSTQAAFAKALSKKALPIQQPRALALIRTRTAVLPYVIDWLAGDEAAASYSEKRLRETVLPLLSPNKDAGTLRSFLNGSQKTPIKSRGN